MKGSKRATRSACRSFQMATPWMTIANEAIRAALWAGVMTWSQNGGGDQAKREAGNSCDDGAKERGEQEYD
jgi:hypothetical protein